jgi:DNA-binding MarR family transcriptional regulator
VIPAKHFARFQLLREPRATRAREPRDVELPGAEEYVCRHMLLKQPMAPNEQVGFLIGAARRRINQAVGRRLRRFRLTPRQFWILIVISEHPGLSLTEIVGHLRMDYPTASRVVFVLRRRKLVAVRQDPKDRRRSQLHLGPLGQSLATELQAIAGAVRGAVTHGLSASEQQALRLLLDKVIRNMDRFHDGGSAREPSRSSGVPR